MTPIVVGDVVPEGTISFFDENAQPQIVSIHSLAAVRRSFSSSVSLVLSHPPAGVIRSQICAISPLPDLDSVYQTIIQNETIRSNVVQESTVMSFASQVTSSNFSQQSATIMTSNITRQNIGGTSRPLNRDPSRKCTGCGKMGHEVSSCFKVIGYPKWWEERSRSRGSSSGRGRGLPPRANSTQIVGANLASLPLTSDLSDADRQGLSGVTDDQWNIIQRMMNGGTKTEHLSGPHYEDADWSG